MPSAAEGSVTAAFLSVANEHLNEPCIRSAPNSEQSVAWTYGDMSERTSLITRWLRSGEAGAAVKPGSFVPFCFDVVPDRVALQLAVLFAGACFVPIDPRFPDSRVAAMLEEACSGLAVADHEEHARLLRRNAPAGTRVVVLNLGISNQDHPADSGTSVSTWFPRDEECGITPESPAYVMFTSGSTGRPKGVVVPHRGISRLCVDTNFIRIQPGRDVMMHSSNPAFDYSTLEVFGPLLNGAAMQLVEMDQLLDTAQLRSLISRLGITIGCFTTSVFNAHARADISVFSGLRVAFTSGEVADAGLIRRMILDEGGIHAPAVVCNALGHTEATTFSTFHIAWDREAGVVDLGSDSDNLPVGRPVARSSVRVVADDGTDVTAVAGAIGELWCGGRGVALGYLNRPEATARAFVTDEATGERWYRTGDLVRVDDAATSSLIFVGRADNQVKLRGNRIELDEIERALLAHPSVGSAVVLAHGDDPGLELLDSGAGTMPLGKAPRRVTRLAAYIEFEAGPHLIAATADLAHAMASLRDFIETTKPPFMVPALFAHVTSMPLGSTGKIDRRALRGAGAQALLEFKHDGQVTPIHGERQVEVNFVRRMPTKRTALAEGTATAAFRAALAGNSSRTAVDDGTRRMSYADLGVRVAALVRWLRESLAVAPGDFVAFCLPPVADRIALQLAILFCGGSFVPIDPSAPQERLVEVLSVIRATFVIVLEEGSRACSVVRGAARGDLRVPVMPPSSILASVLPSDDVQLEITEESAACVLFTSGSTGVPKGVVIPHRSITRLCIDSGPLELEASDVMLHAANPSFDASLLEVFSPLLSGASVSLANISEVIDPSSFKKLVDSRKITAMFLTTSVFNAHALSTPEIFSGLRLLMFGGEAANPSAVRHACSSSNPPTILLNGYGPTEATVFTTTHTAWDGRSGVLNLGSEPNSVPIGSAVSRSSTRVVDDSGEDVSSLQGACGELWCGGRGVALGYLHRLEATAATFVTEQDGSRWYRTGDLVRVENAATGCLSFIGRLDHQVKLRGNRIELAEVERALLSHPRVSNVVVLPHGEDATAPCPPARVTRLAAYIQLKGSPESQHCSSILRDLREWLRERVLGAAVPALFATIGSVGHTATGKLDRAAVRKAALVALSARDSGEEYLGDSACTITFLAASDSGAGAATPDLTDDEATLLEELVSLWHVILRMPRSSLGPHSDWFECGGDSLQAALLARRAGKGARAGDVLQTRTPLALTRRLLARSAASASGGALDRLELTAVADSERVPLTFAQWSLVAHEGAVRAASSQQPVLIYHEHLSQEMPGHVNVAAMSDSLRILAERHDILRLRFDLTKGLQWTVPVESMTARDLLGATHDFRSLPADEAERRMERLCVAMGSKEIPLDRAPPFRTALFLLPAHGDDVPCRSRLHWLCHHLIVDGVGTFNVMLPDLEHIYAAMDKGLTMPLPASTSTYCSWAKLEQSTAYQEARSQQWRQQLAFWRTALRSAAARVALERLNGAVSAEQLREGTSVATGQRLNFELSADITSRLRATARSLGVSLFSVLSWACSSLLSRWTYERSITLLSIVAQREHSETAHLAGDLLNTVALPFVHGPEAVSEAIRRFNGVCASVLRHSEVPFSKVAAEAAPPGFAADLNVAVVLEPGEDTSRDEDSLGWTWSQRAVFSGAAKFDLTIEFDDRGKGRDTLCRAEYRTAVLTSEAAERFVAGLRCLLQSVSVASPDLATSELLATIATVGGSCSSPLAPSGLLPLFFPRCDWGGPQCVGLWFSQSTPLSMRGPAIVGIVSAGARLLQISSDAPLTEARKLLTDCDAICADSLYYPAAQMLAPPGVRVMTAEELACDITAVSEAPVSEVYLGQRDSAKTAALRQQRISWLSSHLPTVDSSPGRLILAGIPRDGTLEAEVVLAAAASGWLVDERLAEESTGSFAITGQLDAVEALARQCTQRGRFASAIVVVIQSAKEHVPPRRLRLLMPLLERGGTVVLVTQIEFEGGQLLSSQDAADLIDDFVNSARTVIGHSRQAVTLQDAVGNSVPMGATGRLVVDNLDSGLLASFSPFGELVLIQSEEVPPPAVHRTLPEATFAMAAPETPASVMERPQNGAEALRALMAELLNISAFSMDDDFYALGGDSMSAIQLVSAAAARQIHLRVSMIARLRTPRAIADALGLTAVSTTDSMVVPVPSPARAPQSGGSTTATLCALMASALGAPTFGPDDDFYALGGDSMSAIQLVSAAAAKGIALRVSMIARLRSPAAIAAALGGGSPSPDSSGAVPKVNSTMLASLPQGLRAPPMQDPSPPESGEHPASAIHRWLNGLKLANPGHNDQSFVLHFEDDQQLPSVSATWLERALMVLIAHHDSLRMRMLPGRGGDQAVLRIEPVGSHATLPLVLGEDAVETADGCEDRLVLHQRLDPMEGPTVAAAVVEGGNAVWLAVHHIAMDIFSWNLLVSDLSRAYVAVAERGGAQWDDRVDPQALASAVLPARTAGPGAWARAQEAYANHALSIAHAREWQEALSGTSQPTLPPGIAQVRNGDVVREEVRLSAGELAALQKSVVEASSGAVSMQAVTLAALAEALGSDGTPVVVWLEGHGRDGYSFLGDAAPDVSRTVGWFTAMYPFALAAPQAGAEGQQAQLAKVLHGGTSFNVIRYMTPEASLATDLLASAGGPPTVLFNFAGKGLSGKPAIGSSSSKERFSLTSKYAGPFGGPENQSLAPLVVNCIITADQELVATFDFGVEDDSQVSQVRDGIFRMALAFAGALRRQRASTVPRGLLEVRRPVARVASLPQQRDQVPLSPAPSSELLVQLHAPQGPAASKPALFLVHPAGGQAAAYTVLVDAMAHATRDARGPLPMPVFGIETTPLRPGQETLESVAAQYVGVVRAQQPTGPWLLGGWSLGGLLAHEMARQMEAAGGTVLLVMHLDSRHPAIDRRFHDFCTDLSGSEVALLALLWRHVELVAEQRMARIAAIEGDTAPAASAPARGQPVTYEEVKSWPRAERRARFVARVVDAGLLPMASAQAFVPRFLASFHDSVGLILDCAAQGRPKAKLAACSVFVRATVVPPPPFEGFTSIEEDLETSRAKGDLTYGWQELYQQPMAVELVDGSHETFAFDPYAQAVAEVLVGHLHDALESIS